MNVLLVSPWLPWPPYDGGRIRILETLRYLSRRHTVTLVTSVDRADDLQQRSAVSELCENVLTTVRRRTTGAIVSRISRGVLSRRPFIQSFHYDPGVAQNVRDLTSRVVYDVIQIEFPFLAPYIRAVAPHHRAKKILSMHNIESLRFGRDLDVSQWSKRKLVLLGDHLFFPTWEERTVGHFDGIVAVSEIERAWIRQHAPRATVQLVPNGVDTTYFSPVSASARRHNPYIAFTGVMDYPPNVDAACWFCDEVLPVVQRNHPDLGFRVIGRNPAPQVLALGRRSGVEVTGTVADIRPHVAGALALVVPLRSGGGTRLKILEAMAMARPVIATSIGAEGLEVTPDANILIADDADQFAAHVDLLIRSGQAETDLGNAGRRLVVEKYDWSVCLAGLEDLYGTVLGSAAA
jgi:sugar transferase (PEP-CTERM/EpsH1 system associated)